jgi:hypothetical protein
MLNESIRMASLSPDGAGFQLPANRLDVHAPRARHKTTSQRMLIQSLYLRIVPLSPPS